MKNQKMKSPNFPWINWPLEKSMRQKSCLSGMHEVIPEDTCSVDFLSQRDSQNVMRRVLLEGAWDWNRAFFKVCSVLIAWLSFVQSKKTITVFLSLGFLGSESFPMAWVGLPYWICFPCMLQQCSYYVLPISSWGL